MTAARLRALTCGRVLSCSPVVLCDEQGRRYELVRPIVTCDGATDEKTGQTKPTASPVLTLVIRPVGGEGQS